MTRALEEAIGDVFPKKRLEGVSDETVVRDTPAMHGSAKEKELCPYAAPAARGS
jgi:hypothetical protein